MPSADQQRTHDVLTSLHHIIGYSEYLAEKATAEGRPETVRDLRSVSGAGKRLLSLLKDTFDAPPSAGIPYDPEADAGEQAADDLAPACDARLLIVDDNATNRDMLSRRLEARGYTVRTAVGGRDALAAIAGEPFDAVLLDIMMPEISGLDVLQAIRQHHSVADLPVIMVTSLDTSADVVEALRLGANDYVTKPVDLRVTMARIGTQLALKRATELVKTLNRELSDAQRKIASLSDSSGEVLRDIPGWACSVADDLAPMLHAREIVIFLEKDGAWTAMRPTGIAPPEMEDVQAAFASRGPGRVTDDAALVAVAGMSGTLFGALVVEGKSGLWSEPEHQLLATFARQLGGALELQQLRGQLEAEKQRHAAKRQDLLDRGVTLLALCPRCGRCYGSPAITCGVDAAELDERLVPVLIDGRYELIRLLGSGGMGEVFRARDRRLQRDVAVKVLRADRYSNATVRLRFEREARALAAVRHEGVVMIHDSGDLDDGSGFLVTELLLGWDLRSVLRLHGPASPSQVAVLVTQSGTALQAAHRAGLIHRDIKPANLFLVPHDPLFRAKLLDFGVARTIDLDPELTQSGMLVGTPAYMAPEVIAGQPVDTRSDIYSLSAVAYEALTGRGVTLKQGQRVWFDVLYSQPPDVSLLVAGMPREVDALFHRMLAKEPAVRPSMDELLGAIGILTQYDTGQQGWPPDLFVDMHEEPEDSGESITENATAASSRSTIRMPKPLAE